MTIRIYPSAITRDIDALWIDGISRSAEWMLWIFPESSSLEAEQCAMIVDAFPGLRGCVWYMSPGVGISHRLRDHKRSLGQYPHLISTMISQVTFEQSLNQRKLYSDVGLINIDNYVGLSKFLLDGRGGLDRVMSMLPNSEVVFNIWSRVVQCLTWIYLMNTVLKEFDRDNVNFDSTISNCVQMTTDIGGILVLPWHGHASDMGIVILGRRDVIQSAGHRLASVTHQMSVAEFMKWLEYGVYSPVR